MGEAATGPIETGRKLRCPDNSVIIFRQLLGHGASGAVYSCERISPEGSVSPNRLAAKVIDVRHLRLSRNFMREREKIKREIAILASISHTGVVNLHGVIDSEEMLVLLMDLVEGGELFDCVLSRGAMTEAEARYIFQQVVKTMKFLHSQGVIHRDLKLENILVEKEVAPGYYQIKIADFGLSKLVAGGFTHARSYVGTPQYWAPEVIMAGHDGRTYSFEADIWSMGCLLYVLVGGTYPFNGDDLDDLITQGRYNFEAERFKKISQECKSLIMGMLRVDPKRRLTLEQIEQDPWMHRPMPPEAPCLPVIQQTPRSPIVMNVGPTIVGAQNPEVDPTNVVALPLAPLPPTTLPATKLVDQLNEGAELFNASELLELLGNTFYRFHAAFFAFRMHRKIALEIQTMLLEIKELTYKSAKVFKGFFFTCQQVEDQLEEVSFSIKEGDAALAIALMDQLKDWMQDTVREGNEVRERLRKTVHRAVLLVTYTRDLNAPWHKWKISSGGEVITPCTPPMLTDAPCEAEPPKIPDYRQAREGLFTDIQAIGEGTIEQSEHTEQCVSQEQAQKSNVITSRLLDLLFMSPVTVALDEMVEPSPHHQESQIIPVTSVAVGPEVEKANHLMRGLHELQRVCDILEQCAAFWDNLDLTLGLVQKFKDQITTVLKHSSQPYTSGNRLDKRLEAYRQFWGALRHQCEVYVKGANAQLDRMQKFNHGFNDAVIRNNCALSSVVV
eukprot:Blabericola_migrator_1__7244@NODE_367_length_9377_cov_157_637487_g294_i0_p1_GENE_NODE_367_length_9377_cov_157_637487_g294_i0NODE_367_length_9377_cov_157_637487_g294_i0_p1_ORF_typecomplete_len728_score132_82Pkinase/PF00069_25/2_8e67Pkinase_Tyr/PF07714_17/1_2e43Kinaselike/PF14531_6/4_7e18Kdo/PF06293_14/7e10Kdo/PF06293_14/2_5e03Kdo/PF06293_14/7_4e03Pkinase_fungal/PF17667_1/1_1e09Pkinase_fungal/PF17667_1/1_2e03APH/PF01636_23/9_7e06APH/PF01636_23/7_2e02RIO1/PF01163_22/5_4e07WaaY/PF06176_11/2_3e06YrbL